MVIGESWHGSNCTGLARGLRHLGHTVELIGADQFFPKIDRSIGARAIQRLLSPLYARQFNRHIINQSDLIKPALVVVYKGNHVAAQTLKELRRHGVWVSSFYPDVSFLCHGSVDAGIFKLFDHIFTTKSFGLMDFRDKFGLNNVSLLNHGFDPQVHRPVRGDSEQQDIDVSFIGTWSPHKERLLSSIALKLPEVTLRIWGSYWDRAKSVELTEAIVGHTVSGDFYAEAIARSRINLGLLSEKRAGASSGDKITSRSFHIPACGGFMLHERTDELALRFHEGDEVACFSGADELVEQVRYYLANSASRHAIALAGRERCVRENALSQRGEVIIDTFEQQRGLSSDYKVGSGDE